MATESVSVAVAVAREHGLRVERPVVLRDVVNVIVDLAPSGVVARTSGLIGERRGAFEHAAREIAVASFLVAAGAPVGRPATELPPGPHVRDGHVITFWQLVDHDRARLDPVEAARALRVVHEALLDYRGPLPDYDFLAEIDGLLANDALASPADLALLRAARAELELPDAKLRPLHGDVWVGNVLATPEGHLWNDFENACLGPLEYDLAALEWKAQWDGDEAARATLRAYGPYDEQVFETVLPLHALFLTAWNLEVVRAKNVPLSVLEGKLAWWRRRAGT